MHLAGTGEASNYGAEAAADNEPNLAKVQNYGAAIAQQPGDVQAQRLALATRNNPPVAAHDGDASDFAGLKRQAHKPPTRMRSRRRKSPPYSAEERESVVRKPCANFAGKLRMTEIHRNDCFGSLSDSHVRPRPLSAKLAQTRLISAYESQESGPWCSLYTATTDG
jgi:hypothetical protein